MPPHHVKVPGPGLEGVEEGGLEVAGHRARRVGVGPSASVLHPLSCPSCDRLSPRAPKDPKSGKQTKLQF